MTPRPIAPAPASAGPLVEVSGLAVRFRHGQRTVHALNGVDLTLQQGRVLCLLGESGSGKSVTLRALMRLLPARRTVISGSIVVGGRDVMALGRADLSDYRGRIVSMVFQEPMLAFDPVFTVGRQITEMVRRHDRLDRDAARARALELFERVQIPSAARRLDAYPHELSGGMRQRAMIALALACRPALLLADEPTTALDATVQMQVLLLLRALQKELGMSVIFVTHDIAVAAEIADSIGVMYAGRLVESGSARDVIHTPRHPYTRGLLASTVTAGMRGRRLDAIPGAPPGLDVVPDACSFAPRCPRAEPNCLNGVPPLDAVGGSRVRCIHPVAAPTEDQAFGIGSNGQAGVVSNPRRL